LQLKPVPVSVWR